MFVVVTIKAPLLPEKRKQFVDGKGEMYLPEIARQVYQVEAENDHQLVEIVQALTTSIVQMQGMLVKDDPYHSDESKPTTARKWIPMHMLGYLAAEVEKIPVQEGIKVQ